MTTASANSTTTGVLPANAYLRVLGDSIVTITRDGLFVASQSTARDNFVGPYPLDSDYSVVAGGAAIDIKVTGEEGPTEALVPARLSTDANGQTVLVGAGGDILNGLGRTITVGAGGQYATIQEAIAGLSASDLFTPAVLTSVPASITIWSQGDLVPSLSNFSNSTVEDYSDIWFQVAGDTRKYPLQTMNPGTPDSIISKIARIDASISEATAISFFRSVPVNILLLDAVHQEKLVLDTPFNIRIDSLVGTVWKEAAGAYDGIGVFLSTSALYGRLEFGRNIKITAGIFGTGAGTPTASEIVYNNTKFQSDASDLNDLSTCGCVTFNNPEFVINGSSSLSHYFLSNAMPGALTLNNPKFFLGGNRGSSAVKLFPFDTLSVKHLRLNGGSAVLDDFEGRVTQISLFSIGGDFVTHSGFSANDFTITSRYPSSATVSLFDEMPYATPNLTARTEPVSLINCHIDAGKFTGTKNLYRPSTGGSGRVVTAQCCSGGVIGTPSAGSRTITALVT